MSLGHYAHSSTEFETIAYQKVQNDVRSFFEIASVEEAGGVTRVKLAKDPLMTWEDGVISELGVPGRIFTGPAERSFRIVTSSTVSFGAPSPAPSSSPAPSFSGAPTTSAQPSVSPTPAFTGAPSGFNVAGVETCTADGNTDSSTDRYPMAQACDGNDFSRGYCYDSKIRLVLDSTYAVNKVLVYFTSRTHEIDGFKIFVTEDDEEPDYDADASTTCFAGQWLSDQAEGADYVINTYWNDLECDEPLVGRYVWFKCASCWRIFMNEITVFGNEISEAQSSSDDDTDNGGAGLILAAVLVGGVSLIGVAATVHKLARVAAKREQRQETELGVVADPKFV